ncbi:succinate-semialdehyde dehydrogenase / glutarate-semialdehyde dehydrogenase [Geodermatophilus dictyosporus]|uniref:Succinate-semialdehyde dehydrogenase / glutarate-semialdehyde dehydrogenase n=1 Tax=Geodermatophilus dictyosporus TaxID=1523247 RepID=A0A1I5JZH3_9ACTN|nr:NAD-dependent succinate-semialdehyde dehydrogenase [Geodermatophilus dictyosporus]SFO78214.1 succinate-semialdehyde dehydrogenase / glutarate-semialdehyde dehydrogenase [Geodermatophilus dictyosporus]
MEQQYEVLDPRTGETVRSVPTATDEEVAQAVEAAATAHRDWSRRPPAERAAVVRRVGELHRERADELAAVIEREMGKPHADGVGEVEFSADIYAYYADHAEEFLADEPIEVTSGEGTALIRRASVGTVLGIMPWNYPYYQVARFAAPNLVTGNTVLLKHAPQCPESAAAIAEIFREAGAPEGVYVNVYASNEQVETIIAAPTVRGVSLTGSERAGAAVAATAGRHLKKVVLELGGSDPFIVLSTDDVAATAEAAVAARMENTGQACNAGKRVIVVDELYDDFLAAFRERLLAAGPEAPLSSPRAAANLADQVDRAVAQGARLETAGERSGAFFPAGVLTEVRPDNDVYREELFGPVAQVHRARDEQHAVELANDTPYGLGSYVFTTDPEQAMRVADALDTGMVFVNGVGAEGPELPFGGTKRSGFGRELGRLGMDEFVNRKLIRTVA